MQLTFTPKSRRKPLLQSSSIIKMQQAKLWRVLRFVCRVGFPRPTVQGRHTPDGLMNMQDLQTSEKPTTRRKDTNLRPCSAVETSDRVVPLGKNSKQLAISYHLLNGPAQGTQWQDHALQVGGHHNGPDSCALIAHLSPEMCIGKERHEKRMAIVQSFLHDVAASSWGAGYNCMR